MEIRFLQTATGKEPAGDYILSLDSKQRQKVAQTLESIRNLGGRVPSTMLKRLKGTNIWEGRVSFAGNIFRLLSFFDGGNLFVAHGFTKKTQKTPKREINTAERRRREYFT